MARLTYFLVTFCIILLLAPVFIRADDDDDDDVGGGDKATRERKQKFVETQRVKEREMESELKSNNRKLEVKMTSKSETNKDMIRFSMDVSNGKGVDTFFQYFSKSEVKTNQSYSDSTQSRIKFRLRAVYLVEFNSTQSNVPITGNNSNILQYYRIGGQPNRSTWGQIAYSLNKTSGVMSASVNDGVFFVDLRAANVPVPIYGKRASRNGTVANATVVPITTLTPNSVKFDYSIKNFPWRAPDGQSQLAVVTHFFTASTTKSVDDDKIPEDRKNVTIPVDAPTSADTVSQAAFWWQPKVSASNGASSPILVNITSSRLTTVQSGDADADAGSDLSDRGYRQVFTIQSNGQHFDYFLWDPEVAMVDASFSGATAGGSGASNTASAINAPSSLIVLLILAITALLF